jgi:hypothetical protein
MTELTNEIVFNNLWNDADINPTPIESFFVEHVVYFSCGLQMVKRPTINWNYINAISLIGKYYPAAATFKTKRNSSFHCGISFLAGRLMLSKKQIKALRSTFKRYGGFVHKIPYDVSKIVLTITDLLKEIWVSALISRPQNVDKVPLMVHCLR